MKNMCQKQETKTKIPQATYSSEQLTEKIRKVAQDLYAKRGYVPGHELDDWLQAEKIIKAKCGCPSSSAH